MKKFLFIALALTLAFGQVCFADIQIDQGQAHGTAPVKFFVGRVSGHYLISADRVVVWDSTSKDGVSVTVTTTSGDQLVAGITLDTIQGISSDSVTTDVGRSNWGRIQTWGIQENVQLATGLADGVGAPLCASSTAGSVSACAISADAVKVGVSLEAVSGASGTIDMMVKAD